MDTINVEVIMHRKCSEKKGVIKTKCEEYLRCNPLMSGSIINNFNDDLSTYVQSIIIEDTEDCIQDISKVKIQWHFYTLDSFGPQIDNMQGDQEHECIPLAMQWVLPSTDFFGLWENLIYETNIKKNLLKYIETTMLFSEKGVDSNIICSNRVVLLHGPPGTGKTSLCKALAQKLAIRLKSHYSCAQLVEINSHSLFSKWFSESGKLVTSMFSKIRESIDNPKTLVCVLIDEVESLAHARKQCMSGVEPSDSIRVVNALLTQIDQLKHFPNVLILTTSNMTGIIDLAFVDRADIKQFIDLPSSKAIYQIYYGCIQELMRTEIVSYDVLLPIHSLKSRNTQEITCSNSQMLMQICDQSKGFSGRALRKIPFIAHALFLQESITTLQVFLNSLQQAVSHVTNEKIQFNQ